MLDRPHEDGMGAEQIQVRLLGRAVEGLAFLDLGGERIGRQRVYHGCTEKFLPRRRRDAEKKRGRYGLRIGSIHRFDLCVFLLCVWASLRFKVFRV
jgi:hypothetical protein